VASLLAFWFLTSCSSIKVHQHFSGMYRLLFSRLKSRPST
jgi:hypothetical protein